MGAPHLSRLTLRPYPQKFQCFSRSNGSSSSSSSSNRPHKRRQYRARQLRWMLQKQRARRPCQQNLAITKQDLNSSIVVGARSSDSHSYRGVWQL